MRACIWARRVSFAGGSRQKRYSQLRGRPGRSGNDVVAAATMPPVGAYVRALSVISDRITASCQGPSAVHFPVQSRQKASVASRAVVGSLGAGGGRRDEEYGSKDGVVSRC